MPRYKLRTLMYLVAFGPPVLAVAWTYREIDASPYVEAVSAIAESLFGILSVGAMVVAAAYVAARFSAAITKR